MKCTKAGSSTAGKRATAQRLTDGEQHLVTEIENLTLDLNNIHRWTYVAHHNRRNHLLHNTVRQTPLDTFAAQQKSPIRKFMKFYIYATPQEIEKFFTQFTSMVKAYTFNGPLLDNLPRQVIISFFRSCAADDAWHKRDLYTVPNDVSLKRNTLIPPIYFRFFFTIFVNHTLEEGRKWRSTCLAFAMGSHHRLAAGTIVTLIANIPDMFRMILSYLL